MDPEVVAGGGELGTHGKVNRDDLLGRLFQRLLAQLSLFQRLLQLLLNGLLLGLPLLDLLLLDSGARGGGADSFDAAAAQK